jgi:hypothetical protein
MDFNVIMESLQKTLELNKQDLEMTYKYDDNEGTSFVRNQLDFIHSITNFLTEYEKLSKKEKPEKPVCEDYYYQPDFCYNCPNCKIIVADGRKDILNENGEYISKMSEKYNYCQNCGQKLDWGECNEQN